MIPPRTRFLLPALAASSLLAGAGSAQLTSAVRTRILRAPEPTGDIIVNFDGGPTGSKHPDRHLALVLLLEF